MSGGSPSEAPRAPSIVVRTTVVEQGLYRDDYEAFVEKLCAQGLNAHLEEPREYRSVEHAAVEVGIWLGNHVGDIAAGAALLDIIRRAAAATISRRKPGRARQHVRRIPIYGSRGEILEYVELPAIEEDGSTQNG